ncbi:MAG: hypothetical protein CBARDMAM_6935 [uncultured Caballeronia sp.]|nr:MAG: hypothetical protein CBARDMAM_6935 [uncultured Caballeronia sp.]
MDDPIALAAAPEPRVNTWYQLLRFLVVGSINTVFVYALFAVFTWFGMGYPLAPLHWRPSAACCSISRASGASCLVARRVRGFGASLACIA